VEKKRDLGKDVEILNQGWRCVSSGKSACFAKKTKKAGNTDTKPTKQSKNNTKPRIETT
jgi:hypothetical protein